MLEQELVATGAPLCDVLASLGVRLVESQADELLGSILLLGLGYERDDTRVGAR